MTLLYSHRDSLHGPAREAPPAAPSPLRWLRRAAGRIRDGFGMVHRAIVRAKTRRPRRELMLYADGENHPAKFPRRPLILGDKWDF